MPLILNADPSYTGLVAWLLMAIASVGIGIYFRRMPASRILEWDQSTAYWIYNPELRASGDKEKALAKASRFYKIFGLCYAIFAAIHVIVVTIALTYRLLADR